MPRTKAGELTLGEIRNLVRQHNKLSVIKGVDSKTRTALLKEVAEMGYRIDHAGKKIVRGTTSLSAGKAGEVKPNKTTKKKKLIAGGEKPVLASAKTAKTKAAAEAAAAKKKKIAKFDQMVKGYPNIPPNKKGKKIKPDRSKIKAGVGY